MWGSMTESDSCSFISLSHLIQIFIKVVLNEENIIWIVLEGNLCLIIEYNWLGRETPVL